MDRKLSKKEKTPALTNAASICGALAAVGLFLLMVLVEKEDLDAGRWHGVQIMLTSVAALAAIVMLRQADKERKKKKNLKNRVMRRKIVAGNWKMNTTPMEGVELAKAVAGKIKEVPQGVELIVAPPFTHLSEIVKATRGSGIAVSSQNCAAEAKGAYTGEVSAQMVSSLGVEYVILGHSERRQYYGENGEILAKKMRLAFENNLSPIFCIGEVLEERESGRHFEVVSRQIEEVLFGISQGEIKKTIIAYEPVWAIGTGKTATAEQAQEMHAHIRKVLAGKFGQETANSTVILYGGSCNPSNAAEIFSKEDVDGGLIGGASLKADDFIGVARGFAQ